jgi:hypothetical protein
MRFLFVVLSFLVGIQGCTRKAELQRDGVSLVITNAHWKVSKLIEGTWKVGKLSRDLVSRNLTVILDLPVLEGDDENFLREKRNVDAWLVRVVQSSATNSRIELGTIYVPFRGQVMGRSHSTSVKSISFALTYAASAMSERFRSFTCPAFSHDKRLDDYELEGPQAPVEVAVGPGMKFEERVQKTDLVPNTFNVGHTMVGEYHFEVALYSSGEKRLHSTFQKLPFTVKVRREKSVTIEGCAGVHPELEPAP